MMLAYWLAVGRVGWTFQTAKLDITAPERLPLGGYTARGAKVGKEGGEPLFARVLLFREGRKSLAMVSCEMLTIPDSLYQAVRKRLPRGMDLFLCATHTHCAPDSQMLNDHMTIPIPGIATFRPRWLNWYADRIACAVQAASVSPRRALVHLCLQSVSLNLNRGRRKLAEPNPVGTLVSSGSDPLFYTYAAHPVFFGPERMEASGDWAGHLADRLGCLILPGAIGDVSPKADGATAEKRIDAFVDATTEALAHAPLQAMSPDLNWSRTPIDLNPVQASPAASKAFHAPTAILNLLVKRFAPIKEEILTIKLGSLRLVGVPGEPSSRIEASIRARAPISPQSVLILSHVNGWMGYILDPQDYDDGGYEAALGFYGREEGDLVVAAAVRALCNPKTAPTSRQ
jgi:neutral ceramidase